MILYEMIKDKKGMPCEFKKFKVKGKPAIISDFGEMKDTDSKHAQPYSCKCMKFIPAKHIKQYVLDKYNITYAEALEICDELESKLNVGECGYCV